MYRRRAEAGLSIIEVTVVGVIVAIVLVASMGQYQEFLSNQRLKSLAETVASDLRAAQQLSVSRRRTVVAVFTAGLYTVSSAGSAVKIGRYPPDIAGTSETVTFTSLGTTPDAGAITLRSTLSGRTKRISILSTTGRVRID